MSFASWESDELVDWNFYRRTNCRSDVLKTVDRVATQLENLEKSGNSKVVREKSGKLKFAFWTLNELKSWNLQLLAACGPGLWICSSLTLL